MNLLLKVVLLGIFATAVFIPRGMISETVYWSFYLFMFCILFLYYRMAYWVSLSDVQKLNIVPKFSHFCAKIPPLSSEDLVRGRLVVTDTELLLIQKNRNLKNKKKVSIVWRCDLSAIESFSLETVVGIRKGITFSLSDGKEAKFASYTIKKRKESLIEALDWTDS